jgi:hypothetical protein
MQTNGLKLIPDVGLIHWLYKFSAMQTNGLKLISDVGLIHWLYKFSAMF